MLTRPNALSGEFFNFNYARLFSGSESGIGDLCAPHKLTRTSPHIVIRLCAYVLEGE